MWYLKKKKIKLVENRGQICGSQRLEVKLKLPEVRDQISNIHWIIEKAREL